jgi:addiction module HigA family antidote
MAKIRFPHPGEILVKEFLEPMGISAYKLAKAIDVPQSRISAILAGERAITADTGLRLSKFFGLTEGFWIGLQIDYDMNAARDALGKKLDKIEPYHAEAA